MPKEGELTQNEVNKQPISITKTTTQQQQQNLNDTASLTKQQNLMNGEVNAGPILDTGERVEVGQVSGEHLEEPAQPEYISFDAAYIEERRSDNARMRGVRSALRSYMDLKQNLQSAKQEEKQWHLERMINVLVDLRNRCDSYSFFRFSLFSSEAKKKQEIRQVREQAQQELDLVRQDYFTHLEDEFKNKAYADPSIKQRESKKNRERKVIGLGAKKSGKQRILLDELNKQVTMSDYAIHSVKTYLKQKSAFDLRMNRLDFDKDEKELLLKIREYGKLAPVEKEIGLANGILDSIFYHSKAPKPPEKGAAAL